MRHARVLTLAGLAVAVTAVAAYAAQTTVVPVPDNAPVQTAPLEVDLSKTHWGDAEAGAGNIARRVSLPPSIRRARKRGPWPLFLSPG